jgi:hypothetical protein
LGKKRVNIYNDDHLRSLRWDQILSRISFRDLVFENKIEAVWWILTEYPLLFILGKFHPKKHDAVISILFVSIVFIIVFIAKVGAQ